MSQFVLQSAIQTRNLMRAACGWLVLLTPLVAMTQTTPPSQGDTALLVAAEKGDSAALAALVASGANVAARDADGWTPLTFAAANGDVASIDLLIAKGAPVDARTGDGMTPLMLAVVSTKPKAVEALLKGGADISLRNRAGSGPYRLALAGKDEATISELHAKMRTTQYLTDLEDLVDPWDRKEDYSAYQERVQPKVDTVNPESWSRLDLLNTLAEGGNISSEERSDALDRGVPIDHLNVLLQRFAESKGLSSAEVTLGRLIEAAGVDRSRAWEALKKRAMAGNGVIAGSHGMYCIGGLFGYNLGVSCPLVWSEGPDTVYWIAGIGEWAWAEMKVLKNMGTVKETFIDPTFNTYSAKAKGKPAYVEAQEKCDQALWKNKNFAEFKACRAPALRAFFTLNGFGEAADAIIACYDKATSKSGYADVVTGSGGDCIAKAERKYLRKTVQMHRVIVLDGDGKTRAMVQIGGGYLRMVDTVYRQIEM